jgi:hypothetical protein
MSSTITSVVQYAVTDRNGCVPVVFGRYVYTGPSARGPIRR